MLADDITDNESDVEEGKEVKESDKLNRDSINSRIQEVIDLITSVEKKHEEYKINSNQDVVSLINEKKIKLKQCSDFLKSKFFGIDTIIDDIISKIETWYIMPEILERPVIVNLWGLTGVGKTDLVRNLVSFLDFDSKYLEMQMNANGKIELEYSEDRFDYVSCNEFTSVRETLSKASTIKSGTPGIILFDEFQRYRTITEQGSDAKQDGMHDIWSLLSDGKFGGSKQNKESICALMSSILYSLESNSLSENMKKLTSHSITSISYDSAKKWKKELSLDESVTTIMSFSIDDKIRVLKKYLVSNVKVDSNNYSKCLVFISGNLDSLYNGSKDASMVDMDADVFFNMTKRLTILDVKDVLTKMFKPEQIARLGNNHIIYPSLSKFAYNKIIDNCLSTNTDKLKNVYSINLKVDISVNEFLYRNGVFPSQGTRPLFSTINSKFENLLPKIIFHSLEVKSFNSEISYKDKVFTISFDNGDKVNIDSYGEIDNIKELQNENGLFTTSIHEAGHTVLHCLLFEEAPAQVVIGTSISGDSGYVLTAMTDGSFASYKNQMVVGWGGHVAEELVLGRDRVTSGSSQDIERITEIASDAVRNFGMSRSLPKKTTKESSGKNPLASYDLDNSIIEMTDKLIFNARQKSVELLSSNKKFFIEISDALIKNKTLFAKDIIDIAKKYNVIVKEKAVSTIAKDAYEKFKNDN